MSKTDQTEQVQATGDENYAALVFTGDKMKIELGKTASIENILMARTLYDFVGNEDNGDLMEMLLARKAKTLLAPKETTDVSTG